MIVSLVQTKGGSGKSTLALNIAVAFSLAEHPTLLIDADPQGSLKTAFARRALQPRQSQYAFAEDLTFSWDITPKVLTQLDQYGPTGIVVVDTFGYDHYLLWEIVKKSDVVIIPISNSFQDLETGSSVSSRASKLAYTRILFNCDDGYLMSKNIFSIIKTLAAPPFRTTVHDRQIYKQGFGAGLGVGEMEHSNSKAHQEMTQLCLEIIESYHNKELTNG